MSPSSSSSQPKLASRGKRILSTLFDAGITAVAVMLVTLASGQFEDAAPYLNDTIALRVALIIALTYCALHGFTLWRSSQTLGKKLFGLQIIKHKTSLSSSTTDSDRRAALPQLALRAGTWLALALVPVVGLWLQALHLFDIAALFTRSQRTLHDYLASTTVIDLKDRS